MKIRMPEKKTNTQTGSSLMQRQTNLSAPIMERIQPLSKTCICEGNCPRCVSVQAKLKLGPTRDQHEEEADKVAEMVMQNKKDHSPTDLSAEPNSRIQPKEKSLQAAPNFKLTPYVARKTIPLKEQTEEHENEDEKESKQQEKYLTSGGVALSNQSKSYYEDRFGVDFNHVRIHQGHAANQRAQAINAYAFTYGPHIWLGDGVSSGKSKVMAHELAHVVQQTQPGTKSANAQPVQSVQAKTKGYSLQRFAPYWEPATWSGTRAHNAVLGPLGKKNKLFNEAPIPSANLGGADYGKTGVADLYKESNRARTIGIYWKAHHTPAKLNSSNFHPFKYKGYRSKHRYYSRPQFQKVSINNKPACAAIAPAYIEAVYNIPQAETQKKLKDPKFKRAKLFFLLKRCKTVATDIILGELKPAQNTAEASKGEGQVKSYENGLKLTAKEFNDYKTSYPCLVEPTTTPDWHINTSVFDDSNLLIPTGFQYGASKATSRKLVIKTKGLQIHKPPKKVMGKLYVNRDPNHRGVWNYFWWPNKNVTEESLAPLQTLHTDVDKHVIKYLTKAPISKQRKAKPDHTGTLTKITPRVQRYTKITEDPFKYDVWKAKHTNTTGRFNKLDALPNYKDFKTMQYAIDIHKGVNKNTKSSLPDYSSKAKRDDKAYDRVDFWTGLSSLPFGKFRKWFGKGFVSIYNLFIKIKNKVKDRLGHDKKPKGFSKGGFLGTAIKVIYKALKIIGGIVLRKTMDILLNAIVDKVQEKLKEFINPEKLLEIFLDEKKKEQFDAKVAEVKKLQEEFEKKITKTADQLFEEFVKPYLDYLKKIEDIKKIVTTFTTIINLVRWGARVIACLSPPGLGCLWILAEAAMDFALSKLAETCWFLKEITPLLSGIKFITDLPRDLAKMILKLVRDNILPKSVHGWLPKPEDLNIPETKVSEIKCNEGGDGRYKMTPERRAWLEMMKNLGEDKYRELALLMKKVGIPSDRKMTLEYIQKLYKLSKDIPKSVLRRQRLNYKRPAKGKLISLLKFLEEIKTKGESVATPATPQPDTPVKDDPTKKPEEPTTKPVVPDDKEGEGVVKVPLYETVVVGSRPKTHYVDGNKAAIAKLPDTVRPSKANYLVYNAEGKHYSKTKQNITIQLTFPDGESFVVTNIKVVVARRNWHPNAREKKSLKIAYKTLSAYHLSDNKYFLYKGGVFYGYVKN